MRHQQVLAEKVALAQRQLHCCNLCEHRCHVDRAAGERGQCQAGPRPRVFRQAVDYGEEIDLVPSHVVFLSGCDLKCAFCIAGKDAMDPGRGEELSSEVLADLVAYGQSRGARNLQWSGGQPSLFLPAILELMAGCPQLPPIVWKSNFHETPEAMELLSGVADVYLADFKFGNNACASRLAGVDGYVQTVTRNLLIAAGQGRLIVRHLLLPGHDECCLGP